MTTELHSLILERTGGIAGQSSATGKLRRIATSELQAFIQSHLEWMGPQSVLIRPGGLPKALTIPASHVLGRTGSGDLGALGATGLDAILNLPTRFAAKAPLVHQHMFGEIVATAGGATLNEVIAALSRADHTHSIGSITAPGSPDGLIPYTLGGVMVLAPPPSGGSGGIANPLTGNLGIGSHSLYSGPTDLLHFAGGRLFLQGCKIPCLDEGTPEAGHVWVYTTSPTPRWVHRQLSAGGVLMAAGGSVETHIAALVASVAATAPAVHGHQLSQIIVPTGATPGHYITPAPGGGWEILPLPAAGGGLSSPLISPLDIANHAIVSGANALLSFAGGNVLLGGRQVFPSSIDNPIEGQVAAYSEEHSDFRNRFLKAAEITTVAIAGLETESDHVQSVLEALAVGLTDQELADTDGLIEGAANKYSTTANVAAAGAVMASDVQDDGTLATESATEVVSERAIKAYVDAEVLGAGLGGQVPSGSVFPGSPADDDLFYRTDIFEQFQYVAASTSWIGTRELSIEHSTGPLKAGFGKGAGGYILGVGNTAGVRLPYGIALTGVTFQNSNVDTGSIAVRESIESGAATDALTLAVAVARGASLVSQLAPVPIGRLLSVFASGFAVGITEVSVLITYRRHFTAS